MINVVIAEPEALVLEGLKQMVDSQPDMLVVGETRHLGETLRYIQAGGFDVLLLEVALFSDERINVMRKIRENAPDVMILVLSSINDSATVYAAMRTGINGYMSKRYSSAELLNAVRKVAAGGTFISHDLAQQLAFSVFNPAWVGSPDMLTARELEIFALIASGRTAVQISDFLDINVATVNRHKKRIMKRMDLYTMDDLVRYAQVIQLAPQRLPLMARSPGRRGADTNSKNFCPS